MKTPLLLPDICNVYADMFTGYGLHEKEYDLKVKSNVQGVVQAPHKMPYALQSKLKKYLQTLKETDIIADADELTEWVHNIVVLEKKDKQLRVFHDPKPLNAVILREHCIIPSPADVQTKLSGLHQRQATSTW